VFSFLQIRGQQDAARERHAEFKLNMQQIKENNSAQRNQISDMKVMMTTMNEQRAKELKTCDKESIQKIQKVMALGVSPVCGTARLILDKICQFVTGKETASYAAEGADLFLSELIFSSVVKKCSGTTLEKDFIKKIADEVNMDQE
jgi:hypothetical protein